MRRPWLAFWQARGWWGGLLAIGLAWSGQHALIAADRPLLARNLYAAAAILLIAALSWSPRSPALTGSPLPGTPTVAGLWSAWEVRRARFGWPVTVVGCVLSVALGAALSFVLWRDLRSPLAPWLWLAALGTLLGTFAGVRAWPAGDALMRRPVDDEFVAGEPQPAVAWEAAAICVVLLAALYLRLVNLEYVPGIFGDEGERGVSARMLMEGYPASLFDSGWYGVPTFYFYCVSWMLRLVGDSMVGARTLSVLSGVATVWLVYRIGRVLWGARAGLLAAAMLAVAPLALQFSRQATESTPTGTLWAAGFLFLVRALRGRRWSDWLGAGMLFGLSLYFYAAGKLVLLLVPLLGLYGVVRWRFEFLRRYALGFTLMVAAFALTFLPYALVSARDGWQNFAGRAQETSVLSLHNRADTFARHSVAYDPAWGESLVRSVLAHPVSWAQVLFGQMRFTAEVLYRHGDPTVFYQIRWHGGSMIAPLWAALTVLGLIYAAWRVWDARFGLLCVWFWCGMLGPALTINTPSVQRLVCAWPAVMLFPAVMLDRVWAAAWPLSQSLARRWATVPLLALLVYFGIDSYQEYFVHYISLCPYCTETVQARHAQTLGQSYKVYQLGVGDGDIWFGYGSTRFVAKGVEGMEVAALADAVPVTNNNGKGLDFLVYPYNAQYLPLLHLYYPGGVEETVTPIDHVPRFVSYKLSAAQTATTQTLRVTYRGANGQTVTRNEPALGTKVGPNASAWTAPADLAYPVDAVWEGGLVADSYGLYELTLASAAGATLVVDGRIVLQAPRAVDASAPPRQAVRLVLAKGVHDVRLQGRLDDANGGVIVGWTRPGSTAAPVDRPFLFSGPTGGLSGEVWSYKHDALPAALPDSQPRLRCSDPFFGFRAAEAVLGEQPFLAHWSGTLVVPAAGSHTLETISNGPSRLSLDGAVILANATGKEASVTLALEAGTHPVDLEYLWQSGRARLEWYWTRPDGTREVVPPTVLLPSPRSWVQGEIAAPPRGASH